MNKSPSNFSAQNWKSLLYGGVGTHSEREYVYILNIYMILALSSFIVFGLLHVLESHQIIGQMELAAGIAIAINIFGLYVTRNVTLARIFFLVTTMTMLVVMLLTGGTDGTGIFWFFVFPLITFFLAGRKEGLLWMLALYIIVFGAIGLSYISLLHIPYEATTLFQLLICLGVLTIGVYIYQGVREVAQAETRGMDIAKSEFVTLASHQLRTPISAISWFSEMLLSGDVGKLTQEQQDNIEQIYQSNQRMATQIKDMLLVSGLDLNNLPVTPEKHNVADISQTVIEEMKKGVLKERNLRVHEEYEKRLPKLSVDIELMRVLLHNLISNAIKYTPDDGEVAITISKIAEKLHSGSEGSLMIEVRDTGYGIPDDVQSKLFSKFFRAENIKDKDTDGTGLGLYIVKKLLDYTGGTVDFISKEGVGSSFVVMLPLEGMRKVNNERK